MCVKHPDKKNWAQGAGDPDTVAPLRMSCTLSLHPDSRSPLFARPLTCLPSETPKPCRIYPPNERSTPEKRGGPAARFPPTTTFLRFSGFLVPVQYSNNSGRVLSGAVRGRTAYFTQRTIISALRSLAHLQRHVRPAARYHARQARARTRAQHIGPAVAAHQGARHPPQAFRSARGGVEVYVLLY